ncbi:MAG: hypothetical protein V3U76_01350 [Granulosicoccus sp.]
MSFPVTLPLLFALTLLLSSCGSSTGNNSAATVTWHGPWVQSNQYWPGDAVSFNGRSYINILPTIGQPTSELFEPTDDRFWQLLADQGSDGLNGAVGPVGPSSIIWQGAYVNGKSYVTNDAVEFNSRSFINIQNTTGTQDPTATAYWQLLADKGADGVAGATGPAGIQGIQGLQGNDGADGANGSTGPQGSAGNDGADGATGSAGPQGPAGATGSAGINGISINWQGAWVNGTSYASNDAVSFNGRSYIGTQDTSGIEDPTDTAYWDLLSDKGADGAIGVQGLTGATGSQGVAGNDGADGSTGSTGPQGPAGNDGADGATGSTGPQGSAGNDGADGATGSAGPQGLAGNDGADGATGSAGPQGSLEVRYVIAGFTTTPTLPNIGYLGMSDACQAEFGLSARLATSQQAVDTPNITALSGTAWIQAVRNPSGGNGDFVSGVLPTTWSCAGWTASNTATGLALVGSNFTFAKQLCNTSAPVACAVPAGVEYSYVYTGFSTTQVVGNVGYLGVNSACQSEFGANARMATSLEIINSTGLVAQSGTAWVQAVRHPSGGNSDYTSGVTPNTWSCAGWTANSTATSLTVNGPNISFTKQACNTNSYVACSVPQ